jgi:inner membrane organizing system protein 1
MERPPQLQYERNWDATIDLTLRRVVYGSLSGAASALLFFRSPATRWAAVAFGAGVGVGSAFTDSSHLFRGAIGASLPSASSSSPAVDVQQSIHADAPEPKHVEAPKLERFEEPLVQEAQDA